MAPMIFMFMFMTRIFVAQCELSVNWSNSVGNRPSGPT